MLNRFHLTKFIVMAALILGTSLILASGAHAGTSAVGAELGIDTRASIEKQLGTKGVAISQGQALPFITGPTMTAKGDSYGVTGLLEVHYGFDQNSTLGFVGMLMDPARFDATDQILRSKYEFLEAHGEPGANRCSHFASEDAIIELILDQGAPLQLLYVRKDLAPKAQTAPVPAKDEADNF